MKYWLLSLLSLTTLLFLLSCTDSLTGNDDDNNNNNDSITDSSDTSKAAPSAPINVSATKGSSSVYIYVTWDPVLKQGVTSYRLYRSGSSSNTNDKGLFSKLAEADTSDSMFMSGYYKDSITYLSQQTYYYSVVAVNYYGESEWSAVDSGWINYVDPNDTIPQQFDIYFTSTTNQMSNSISIIWYAENDDTSSVINVYKSVGDTLSWGLLAADADTPFVDSSNKLPGTTYYYALTATPEGGVEGLKSTYMELTTPPLGPDSIWVTGVSESSISFAWNSVSQASEYGIYLIGGSGIGFNPTYSTTDTTYTINALMSGVTTSLVVDAVVSNVNSEKSDTLSARTYYTGPYWLTVSNDEEEFISIVWPKLQTYTDTIEGATYTLYKGTDTANMSILDSTLTTTSYIDSNVLIDSMYYYKVSSVDSTGWPSSFSPTKSGKAIKTVVITVFPPDSMWKSGVVDSNVTLSWNSGVGALSYKLYRKSTYDTDDDWHLIASPTDTVYKDTSVIDKIGYYYAVSSVGEGDEESTKYTRASVFVGIGSDYSYLDVNPTVTDSANLVTLNWSKTTNGSEVAYRIYRKENEGIMSYTTLVDSSATSWIDSSGTSGDSLTYLIDAIFDFGGIEYEVGVMVPSGVGSPNYNSIGITLP